MQTVPESHVSTAVCGDFELPHAANYSRGYALMLYVCEEQMDNGFDSLSWWCVTVVVRDLLRERVPEVRNDEELVSL